MRLLITFAVVCLAVSCAARPQDEEYEYDEEAQPAEPASPAPRPTPRPSPSNSRQARGPSLLLSRNTKTTTAPVKPQEPEVVNEPSEVVDDGEEYLDDVGTPSSSTTPAPKKVVAPVVRPFRSNQDLLAALKRRRQQEQQGGTVSTHAATSGTTAQPGDNANTKPLRSNSNLNLNSNSNSNKRTYNRSKAPAPVQEVAQEAEVTRKPIISSGFNRKFTSRGRATSAAPPAEEGEVAEESEEPAPRAAKSYRGGRRS